jgi:hypothetical protein
LGYEEAKEHFSVAFSDAVAYPRAMMVERGHAVVTVLAMFAAEGLFYVTNRAVFRFNEEDYRVIILLLGFTKVLIGNFLCIHIICSSCCYLLFLLI